MSTIDGLGGISDLGKIYSDLKYSNAVNQRVETALENLKGIKGKEGIKKAAQGFESLFITRMLQEMRKTIPKDPFFGDSFGMDIYMSMLDEKIANRISVSQRFGLSDMIIKYLENRDEYKTEDNPEINKPNREMIPIAPQNKRESSILSIGERIEQLIDIINEAAVEYELDPDLLKAVIIQESSGNPDAVSKSGAKGLMQLMDDTAEELGVTNIFDPKENIFAGARYLKGLLIRNKGDLKLSLASYNAGPGAVKLYDGIPPYPETHNYVRNVIKLQQKFRSEEGI